jgi:DNA-binding XRE family transcriptional regulator
MPYIDDLQTLRERAGLTRVELARLAEVDRATLTELEKHNSSRPDICHKIINALNERYYGKNGAALDPDKIITPDSRYS